MKLRKTPQWIRKLTNSAFSILVIAAFMPLVIGWCLSYSGPAWGYVTRCTSETTFCNDVSNYWPDYSPMCYMCAFVDSAEAGCTTSGDYSGISVSTTYICPLTLGECPCDTSEENQYSQSAAFYTGPVATWCTP
jgi:hypothetical protein